MTRQLARQSRVGVAQNVFTSIISVKHAHIATTVPLCLNLN